MVVTLSIFSLQGLFVLCMAHAQTSVLRSTATATATNCILSLKGNALIPLTKAVMVLGSGQFGYLCHVRVPPPCDIYHLSIYITYRNLVAKQSMMWISNQHFRLDSSLRDWGFRARIFALFLIPLLIITNACSMALARAINRKMLQRRILWSSR